MICFGQVRHRFHGNYSMLVGIVFKTPGEAKRASVLFPGFEIQDKALVKLARGRIYEDPLDKRTEVDEVKSLIERWRIYPPGAHEGPIDGVPFSIDMGPIFHLDLTQALIDHHDSLAQLVLFKEAT
jgi:hypothetical protein